MAPPKLLLPVLLVILHLSLVANAKHRQRALHLPVYFRDTVLPNDLRQPSHTVLESVGQQLGSPVHSGVPYNSGEYFVALGVGSPPTRSFLVIDTGSDFTWLQCAPCRRCHGQATPLYDPRRSATHRRVPFSSPQCRRDLRFPVRDARTGGCLYTVVYGDGSSSRGEVATDRLAFPGGGARAALRNVTLGCGRDNEGLFGSAAGVLGVGRGALSLPAQLAPAYGRVFAYCLGDREARAPGGGSSSYLVFGRTPEPPSTAFTPLRTDPRKPDQYFVDMVGFSVDGRPVAGLAAAADLALDPATGRGGVVVDSGTAVSRFAWATYAALRDAFDARASAAGLRNLRRNISMFDTCYDLHGSDVATARVPAVALHFAGGADMVLPRKNYLVREDCESGKTCYCLAFVGFKPSGNERNMLGNVQQQGFRVVFDEERQRIGFAPNGCSN